MKPLPIYAEWTFPSISAEWVHVQYRVITVNPSTNGHSKKDKKMLFNTNCRLMQDKSIAEYSAILSTPIELPFIIKIFVLSTFEWLLNTGFTEYFSCCCTVI